jgi:2-keto-3-deoxy-L-rhamnonate aldolase RhmA
VGTNDLTSSLGIPGEYDNPRLLDAYKRIVEVARRNGKFVRLGGVSDPRLVERTIALGSRLVTVDNDARMLLKAMRAGLAEVQSRSDPELL